MHTLYPYVYLPLTCLPAYTSRAYLENNGGREQSYGGHVGLQQRSLIWKRFELRDDGVQRLLTLQLHEQGGAAGHPEGRYG